ncbi:hypothetical protein V6N13_010102 [Hibiscus sabdariffa]|uniref:CCHC-type domain-containing protein n=1 Tax=Hibiscus sabdariffa TaxID=183260 RepID=A0ABR2PQS6_9ROSI
MESISSPEVPHGNQTNPRIDGLSAPLTGCPNGRPPDTNALVVDSPRLERSATPIHDEDQQVMKRNRGYGKETMDVVVDAQGEGFDVVLQTTSEDCMYCDEGGAVRNDDILQNLETTPGMTKPSFRDMLTGRALLSFHLQFFQNLMWTYWLMMYVYLRLMRIEYEGLPTICYACGRYGNTEDVCKPHDEKVNLDNHPVPGKLKSGAVEERFGPWDADAFTKIREGNVEDEHDLIEENTLVDSSLLDLNRVGDVVVTSTRSMGDVAWIKVRICRERSYCKGGGRTMDVASNEIIVQSKTKLNPTNPAVVKILERQSSSSSKRNSPSKTEVGGNSVAPKGGKGLVLGKSVDRKKLPA